MLTDNAQCALHVVCYDIANDRRRRRLVRELEAFGVRVQESVFECWIDAEQRRRMERTLAALIRPEDDSLACYRLGGEPGEAMVVGGEISRNAAFLLA